MTYQEQPLPMPMTSEQRAAQITALIEERRGYEIAGDTGRIADVDAELRRLGHEGTTPAARAEKRPRQRKAATR